ncbi:MAG: 1,4-dihydroxy-2-naphthoate octaprenyltransferase [Rhodobacteraceae bacterium]|nr:1,4-dihydroxy-2-naphthoate octaprenyltransferase [Paracoccaceae bacterium]
MTETTSALLNETILRLQSLPRPVLWVVAARLKTLGLSLTPVAAGSWVAAQAGAWRPEVMLAAMAAAAMIQVGTNLWNDAADGARGVDGPERLGPPRMTGLGLVSSTHMRRAAGLTFAAATIPGMYLALIGGWPIVAIGLVSLVLGYFYSMGPKPLSHTPLGEILVILFFGVVAVAGTAYLHGQPPSGTILAIGLITGLPAAAVLLLNNHRDRVQDAASGRRTLAILIGKGASQALFFLLLTTAWAGGAALSFNALPSLLPLFPAALLGLVLAWAMITIPISARLNRLIAGTAAYQVFLLVGLAMARALF